MVARFDLDESALGADYRGVFRIFPEGCTAFKINLTSSPKSFLSDIMGTVIITVSLCWQFILFGIIGCEDEIFVNHILLLAKQYL